MALRTVEFFRCLHIIASYSLSFYDPTRRLSSLCLATQFPTSSLCLLDELPGSLRATSSMQRIYPTQYLIWPALPDSKCSIKHRSSHSFFTDFNLSLLSCIDTRTGGSHTIILYDFCFNLTERNLNLIVLKGGSEGVMHALVQFGGRCSPPLRPRSWTLTETK